VTAFSPLARGWLAGSGGSRSTSDRYHKEFYGDGADRAVVDAVAMIAERRGVSMSEVALSWVNQNPRICGPLVGGSRSSHLDEALRALSLSLEPEELACLDALYRPRDVICDQVVNPRPRDAAGSS